ncbi:MAG: 1-acyl-sn-glycerol-3-phosphate acyltransferase [Flavobacteriales bacterium]|nr:1-acyl-sn-glycerol-3-phosphate acyltransferase [Flavobacteriales bacterium]MDG1780879.1 1-acyl-sn-glycerol-3-phosphate acyltransferase [Flavobacteriales bacterium]
MVTDQIDIFNFDDIRPFNETEVPEVIERMLKEPALYEMMRFVYPDLRDEDIQEMMREIKSTEEFQAEISGPAFKVITQTTTSGLTFSNIDNIKSDEAYLFLSNHRDIILDSALLNVSLLEMDFPTTQIAIGDNLLQHQLIKDIVRVNKSFIVNRNVNPKEMLLNSKRLSNYIHHTVCEDKTSVWIAHKEGRSKDGDDRTASGLLKMLSGSEESIPDALKKLNIVPMVVSYEYDPCDVIKANELLATKDGGTYEKKPGEDYHSMLKGLTGHKGGINIAVGTKLQNSLEALPLDKPRNEQIRLLSAEIDKRMHEMYKLWPTNYIAYDLLTGKREFAQHYSGIQRIAFRNYIRGKALQLLLNRKGILKREGFMKQAREVLLQMYANPVINYREAKS